MIIMMILFTCPVIISIYQINNCCYVHVGCPRLMLLTQDSGLLYRVLSGGCGEFPDTVRERLLHSLKDMMMVEEVSVCGRV